MSTLYFPRPGAKQVTTIFDTQRLAMLQSQAAQNPQNPNVQAEVAQQIESIFIQQILKYESQSAALIGAEQSSAEKMAYALNDIQLSIALSDSGVDLHLALNLN